MAYCRYSERNLTPYSGNSASNLKSFFRKTRLLSRRCICIPQGARNAVLQETQPETSNHFSVMFFRKTRLLSRHCICIPQGARNAVLQETQPEPQIIFRRCFFRKTRKMSADVQAYFKRNLTPYSGNSARNLKSFFGDVFFARQGF